MGEQFKESKDDRWLLTPDFMFSVDIQEKA